MENAGRLTPELSAKNKTLASKANRTCDAMFKLYKKGAIVFPERLSLSLLRFPWFLTGESEKVKSMHCNDHWVKVT